jgi:hypothetical protein
MTDAGTLDRDVIDLTDHPANPDDLDRVRAIVLDRCGDVLTEDEIAEAFATEAELDAGAIWTEVMERMCDALGELEERLDALEASLSG